MNSCGINTVFGFICSKIIPHKPQTKTFYTPLAMLYNIEALNSFYIIA